MYSYPQEDRTSSWPSFSRITNYTVPIFKVLSNLFSMTPAAAAWMTRTNQECQLHCVGDTTCVSDVHSGLNSLWQKAGICRAPHFSMAAEPMRGCGVRLRWWWRLQLDWQWKTAFTTANSKWRLVERCALKGIGTLHHAVMRPLIFGWWPTSPGL